MIKFLFSLFQPLKKGGYDVLLLLVRLFIGFLMLVHGLPKLLNFSELVASFPDPIGFGSEFALILVLMAEVACSVFLILGLLTRLTSFVLVVNMLVAAFIVHGADPFSAKELAILYLAFYVILLISGGGKYSLDSWIYNKYIKKN
ncbi:MAG: DoxX family protein [Culturomica sp.]|jgi:putative oxidoreductase|nr:DoxX family protein [Culturomica sp.]